MDDFAKLMGSQGVRRLDERAGKPTRKAAKTPTAKPAGVEEPADRPVPPPLVAEDRPTDPEPVAWRMGRQAAETIQRALARSIVERGGIDFLVRVGGRLDVRPSILHPTVGELAAAADDADAELVIIEAAGWKVIMHPASGVATLVDDPGD